MKRGVRHISAVSLFLGALLSATDLFACSVCFGNGSGPMADGVNMGVITLLAFICGVLLLFAGFFVYLARRNVLAKRAVAAQAAPVQVGTSSNGGD